jgi:hypothetical protein
MSHARLLSVVSLLACCGAAVAQPAVNGRLKPEYGPVRWVNTTPTGFADNAACVAFGTGIRAALNNTNRGGVPGGGAPWAPATTAEQTAAGAVTTGFEVKIPLSEIGNPAAVRIAGLITNSNYDNSSNQYIGGLGGQDSAVVGNNYPGTRTVDLSAVPGNQFVTVPPGVSAASEPAIDGTLDASFYGPALFVQNTRTNYGDAGGAADPNPLVAAGGSEIDAVYAKIATVGGVTSLYVFVAGNIESNFNKLSLFLDTGAAGGQNRLRNDNNAPISDGGPNAMGGPGGTDPNPGLKFDAGFSANYFLSVTAGGSPATAYVDFAKLGTGAEGGAARSLGSTTTTAPIVPVDTCPNDATRRDVANGSEIDSVYAMVCGQYLYVLVTGNLENNGNRLDLFFDAGTVNRPDLPPSVGQNRVGNANHPVDFGHLNRLGADPIDSVNFPGLRFSQGFNADYWISVRNTGFGAGVELGAWAEVMNTCTAFTCAATDGSAPPHYLEYGSFRFTPKTADPLVFDGQGCVRFANMACAPNGAGSAWNPASVPGIDVQGDPAGFANNLPLVDEPYSSFAPRLISQDVFNPFGVTAPGFGAPAHGNLAVPGLLSLYIDNSNTGGVTGTDASKAARVATGIEAKIRLDELGWDGVSPIRFTGFIVSEDHTVLSNQVIGGALPAGQGNLGEPRTTDFQSAALAAGGPFYVSVNAGAASCQTAAAGACCFSGGDCAVMSAAQCAAVNGTPNAGAATCSPSACTGGPATVVCCRGATCAVVASGSCTLSGTTQAGAFSAGAGSSCNAAGNDRQPCCKADYNKQGGVELLDIFAFLQDWFAGVPYADFNGQSGVDLLDIFAFLTAWFAGGC